MYLAMGAASAGGKAFSALQKQVKLLRDETPDEDDDDPQAEVDALAKAFGLSDGRSR